MGDDYNISYITTDEPSMDYSLSDITITLDGVDAPGGEYIIDTGKTTSYIDNPNITIGTTDTGYYNVLDTMINPVEVESMCKEYPALVKVWRNFESVYNMVKQDYKGKKEAGEINDELF